MLEEAFLVIVRHQAKSTEEFLSITSDARSARRGDKRVEVVYKNEMFIIDVQQVDVIIALRVGDE